MGLSHNDVSAFYKLNFALAQFHKWSISEIEEMLPWEREAYGRMLAAHLEEQRKDREEQRLG